MKVTVSIFIFHVFFFYLIVAMQISRKYFVRHTFILSRRSKYASRFYFIKFLTKSILISFDFGDILFMSLYPGKYTRDFLKWLELSFDIS